MVGCSASLIISIFNGSAGWVIKMYIVWVFRIFVVIIFPAHITSWLDVDILVTRQPQRSGTARVCNTVTRDSLSCDCHVDWPANHRAGITCMEAVTWAHARGLLHNGSVSLVACTWRVWLASRDKDSREPIGWHRTISYSIGRLTLPDGRAQGK